LRAGDVLVLNDSRVIPARLFARRQPDSQPESQEAGAPPQTAPGRIEVLLTEQQSPSEWKALVRPGKKVAVGQRLLFASPDGASAPSLTAEVIDRGEFGERTLRFDPTEHFFDLLDQLGHMPLPPYIRRSDEQEDRERYQTVFARTRGSVAAPTAGLHFTPEMLRELEQAGVEIRYLTLHVGLGTFQPVRVERLDQIHLHTERYTLPPDTAESINAARSSGRRVVAAGTTTVRVLEHCVEQQGAGQHGEGQRGDSPLAPHSGETSIFLAPGHRFRAVDALLTNFHLPQSTLLMLVSAFAGREHTLAAYRHAVQAQYRFFSYGDCMFIS
jgi:S-adenosylmethionine:tRNA ribosyltransferase-isomerase